MIADTTVVVHHTVDCSLAVHTPGHIVYLRFGRIEDIRHHTAVADCSTGRNVEAAAAGSHRIADIADLAETSELQAGSYLSLR